MMIQLIVVGLFTISVCSGGVLKRSAQQELDSGPITCSSCLSQNPSIDPKDVIIAHKDIFSSLDAAVNRSQALRQSPKLKTFYGVEDFAYPAPINENPDRSKLQNRPSTVGNEVPQPAQESVPIDSNQSVNLALMNAMVENNNNNNNANINGNGRKNWNLNNFLYTNNIRDNKSMPPPSDTEDEVTTEPSIPEEVEEVS